MLRRYISYTQINLMERLDVEMQDIIFCRNVIIYFDKETKKRLVGEVRRVTRDRRLPDRRPFGVAVPGY